MKKTSLKIMSTKAETTEIKLRTVSKHEMALIKVIGNQKTSLRIILTQAETTEIMLRICSKYKMASIKVIHIKLLLHPFNILNLFSSYSQWSQFLLR